MREKNGFAEGI